VVRIQQRKLINVKAASQSVANGNISQLKRNIEAEAERNSSMCVAKSSYAMKAAG